MASFLETGKNLFGLVGSIHAAWPALVIAAGLAAPFLIAIPPWAIFLIALAILLAMSIIAYKLRHAILYISLEEAATRSYERLEGTLYAKAAERLFGSQPSPQNTTETMAKMLLHDGRLPLYGRKPPSRVLRRIDEDAVRQSSVIDNARTLKPDDPARAAWQDLAVHRLAFRRRLSDMEKGRTGASSESDCTPG